MSMPSRLSSYLFHRGTRYEVCVHRHSRSSAETARSAHVSPHQLAKPVILEDDTGCLMAVIPADRTVMLGRLAQLLGRRELHLADERRIVALFDDCDRGAVPPVGMAWGIETIVDEELDGNEVLYLEGGDHEWLLRLTNEQFRQLMSTARHAHFCKTPTH